jgi:hypothetical protein
VRGQLRELRRWERVGPKSRDKAVDEPRGDVGSEEGLSRQTTRTAWRSRAGDSVDEEPGGRRTFRGS